MIEGFGDNNRRWEEERDEALEDFTSVVEEPTVSEPHIEETNEGHDFWLREGRDMEAPSIYRAAGINTGLSGEAPNDQGQYTEFWGGRMGYARAAGHLSREEASKLCRDSGFTNWQRRKVLPAEERGE